MTERELFIGALHLRDPAGRAAFLDRTCGADGALRGRVEALLREQEQLGSFLERPAEGLGGTRPFPPAPGDEGPPGPREGPGTVLGPYKLVEVIGEGGMGTVWLAQQAEPVKRLVALKVIKAGMDSKAVLARFEQERQALALMDHPHIAKVLDGGVTPDGRPYFVMELVKGVPLTAFCDERRLTPRERLALFVPVCQAVQHAHQKGVIHRDLKPSNVLVALYDGRPVPKVIDFGVAKATGQQLTERTLVTGLGVVVGTPEYMSPEQAELNQLDIDTRSDVYSLGVLLYELLTGTTPLQKKRVKAALLEVLRLVREEDPPPPSSRLSTTEELPRIAANRGLEPRRLSGLVRGELDWIVMKCLEKDRNRRYESADGLARDLERYLRDEPVEASPPGAGYRLRKFVQRNKGRVAAAGLVLAALLVGMAGTTWGMIRAEQARRDAVAAQAAETERAEGERRAKEEAQKRLAQVETGTEILAAVFRDLNPMAAELAGVTPRDLLGRRLGEAARQLEGEAVGDPLVVARLQHLLGISLRELGHLEQAEAVLVKAYRTRERLLGAEDLDTVATKHHLALLYREQANYALAEALHKEVVAVRTAKQGADHPDTLTSRHHLAWVYQSQGKFAPAETLFQEVLAARTARLGADHPDTLHTQHRLAALQREQGKFALAEALHKEVLAVRTARLGARHLDTLATKDHLAGLYLNQGKDALAETLFQEVLAVRTDRLGADHPDTLTSRHHLASLYLWQGKFDLAETLLKEVLAVRTARLGAHHPDTLGNRLELGALYHWQENYAPAEALYKEVLAVGSDKLGADHRIVLNSRHSLAMLYWSMWKLDQSIPLMEETLKLRKAKYDPDHPTTLAVQADLGILYCAAGRFADAIPLLEEVHQKGREDPELARVGQALLNAYVWTGKATEATALATEQVQAARQQFADDGPQLATALAAAGRALLDVKAYAAAEPLLRESLSLAEKQVPDAWSTHHVRSLLGDVLMRQQRYADAEPFLVQGYTGMKERKAKIPPEERGYLTTSLERLVDLYTAWVKPDEAAKWRKELEKAKEKP